MHLYGLSHSPLICCNLDSFIMWLLDPDIYVLVITQARVLCLIYTHDARERAYTQLMMVDGLLSINHHELCICVEMQVK